MNCFHFGNKIIWRYFYYFFNTYASPPCDGDWMLGSKVRGHSLLHRVTEYREVKDLSVLKAQFTQTEERTFVMTVRWTVPLNSDCTRKRSHRWNYDTSFNGSVSSRGAHPPPWEPLLYLNGVLPKKKKKKTCSENISVRHHRPTSTLWPVLSLPVESFVSSYSLVRGFTESL